MLDVTAVMVEEHRLILRMIAQVEYQAAEVEAGRSDDWRFFLDAVDFIRSYADRFHHAKEEDVLFVALVANGMPEKRSPIEAMLIEHDQGRAFVAAMEGAARAALAGDTTQAVVIVDSARGYAKLLRDHIHKEDTILYPLAERVLPAAPRPGMIEAYTRAEAAVPADFTERWVALIERYEARVG
jgi:hemerythrin-like domain-containing protein